VAVLAKRKLCDYIEEINSQDRPIRYSSNSDREHWSRKSKIVSQLISKGANRQIRRQCRIVFFLWRNPAVITTLSNWSMLTWSCLKYSLSSLSMRSRLVSASSARRAEVFTPSPLLWVFSIMEQARNTKAGTVSCFSCLGISTSVQYCVSSLITS